MKKIIITSYYSTQNGSVMSELVMDLIKSLSDLGYQITLITSIVNPKIINKNLRIIRTASIAPSNFWKELKKTNIKLKSLKFLLLIPIVLTIGAILELIERFFLRRLGDGGFSWFFLTTIVLLFAKIFSPKAKLFSTGGPLSSHISTLIVSKVLNCNAIYQFQDPLVGDNIGHNNRSRKYLLKLEKLIVDSKSKIVYITKQAQKKSQQRYPNNDRIFGIYTSSYNYSIEHFQDLTDKKTINFLHLGTIYSTRNYDYLNAAIEKIMNNNRFYN